ncbi:hypothetical protein FRC10_006570 [Ceratobasidium sp. 414]|nr:hypothetical protein FRC10_006570 [Ceratobasidium sp. 414]
MPGDDLDDGLVIEPAFVDDAESDTAASPAPDGKDKSQEPIPIAGKKRKRAQKPPAERKTKKPKQPHDAPARLISMCQPPEALTQVLERALIRAFPKMSDLEREELAIPASRIAQRPKHHAAPTAIVVAGAALRVADLTRTLRPLKGESGGEIAKKIDSLACILTSKPIEPIERAVPQSPSCSIPAKLTCCALLLQLFAKHFKLKDHIAYLAKTRVSTKLCCHHLAHSACQSTLYLLILSHYSYSNRLSLPEFDYLALIFRNTKAKLIYLLSDALSVKALSHIVLDMSHLDSKQRSLLDIPETRVDTLKGVLGNERISERLANGKTKLVLF